MKPFSNTLARLAKYARRPETLEWGLVCGLIIVAAITVMALIGPDVTPMWNDVNSEIPASD